jgi:type II secretory pathway pseudopilin PulG
MIDPLHIILAIVAMLVVTLWVSSRRKVRKAKADAERAAQAAAEGIDAALVPDDYAWRYDTFDGSRFLRKTEPTKPPLWFWGC